ncbi:DEAD/DEAH box helicase [Sulfobacillus thermosulfidooxidans]|uniref:DEAD/DEAH box helicase n=1 Tax=Sulfobacillus thermosulfidooxidans TaxID=28034 RepID=UPI0009E946E4|nr:DEAD/DEAH box helicase [Sulfobacillus thermosulfidooxidans]
MKHSIRRFYTEDHPLPEGLAIRLMYGDKRLELPLVGLAVSMRQLVHDASWPKLALLDDLWHQQLLISHGDNGYLVPWSVYFNLEKDDLEGTNWPLPVTPHVSLYSTGSIVHPGFRIRADVRYPGYDGNLLLWGRRTGPWIVTSKGPLMMDAVTYRLLTLLEQPAPTALEEKMAWMAEIKEVAQSIEAKLDDYLNRENYVLVDDIEIQPVLDDPEHLHCEIQYRHEGLDEGVLRELSANTAGYIEIRHGTQRQRVVAKRVTKERVQQIRRQLPSLYGSQVPQFLKNPEAFIPENLAIDLAQFSQRVRGLKLRVYRAQPFVNGQANDRGWFELDAGVRVEFSGDGEDQAEPKILSSEMMRDLANHATDEDRFVRFEDGWIELPHHYRETVKAIEEITQQGPIAPHRLPYVLDIFTNLDVIDFNQPLHEQLSLDDEDIHTDIPSNFCGQLLPHQWEGFQFLIRRHRRQWGVLLADEMGLGKTIQAIAFLTYLQQDNKRPNLIVAPLSVLDNWKSEIHRFAPSLQVLHYYGPNRHEMRPKIEHYDVVVSTYETVTRDQLELGKINWHGVILDEAQNIKNVSTARTEAVKALKNHCRIAMTGTPVENSLRDLWSLIDFVQPGFLGSLKEFRDQFEKPTRENSLTSEVAALLEKRLTQTIRPIYLRRTKSEVQLDLPEKKIQKHCVPLGPEQKELYQKIVMQVKQGELSRLAALDYLRNILGHPWALRPHATWTALPFERVPKLHETLKILESVKTRHEKALIFTTSLSLQRMLQEWIMKEFDKMAYIVNGETFDRQNLVQRFNADEGFGVMILTPRAGGVGLTITGANHVIHYTRWWNPAVENQATDRVHRLGQNRTVTVYYPLAVDRDSFTQQGTVDEIVDRLLSEKQLLADYVVVPSSDLDLEQEILRQTF